MNKSTRIYLVILLILVVAFFVNKLSNNNVEKRIRFFDFDSLDIAKIVISNDTDTLALQKEGEIWRVGEPIRCDLNEKYFKTFMSKILPVETSSIPVSVSTNSHKMYNVTDSLGTAITFYGTDNGILDESIVGKSTNYNFSHGRKRNKKEVYQLNSNISYNIDPSLNRWRKKEVLQIPEEDLISVTIQNENGSFKIDRGDSLWTISNGSEEIKLSSNNNVLQTIKDDLKNLMASDFIDNDFDAYLDQVENPAVLVTVLDRNNNVINLKFSSFEENKYIMQLGEQKDPLYIVYEHIVKHFQKNWDDFK